MSFVPSNNSSGSFPRPRFSGGFKDKNQNNDEHRINERIRIPRVRVIDENGGQVGVIETREALRMAKERGLDLVEVSPTAQPPVCKIMDYGKFKYEQKKKEHQAKKKQTVIKVKEIQLRPQTEDHDLEYKFRNIRQFLEDGDKAKVSIFFRGREIAYLENGHKMLRELQDEMKDIAVVDAPPKLEGKRLIMILSPAPGAVKKKPAKPNPAPANGSGGTPEK